MEVQEVSIYIKGMGMPKTYPLIVTIYPNGQVLSETVGVKDKHGFAVRVPPHGRCIDEKSIVPKDGYIIADGIVCIPVKDIINAPTIIPASVEGE